MGALEILALISAATKMASDLAPIAEKAFKGQPITAKEQAILKDAVDKIGPDSFKGIEWKMDDKQ